MAEYMYGRLCWREKPWAIVVMVRDEAINCASPHTSWRSYNSRGGRKREKDERDERADALRRVQFILTRLLRQGFSGEERGKQGKTIFSLSGARSRLKLNTHIGRSKSYFIERKLCAKCSRALCHCEGFPFLLHGTSLPAIIIIAARCWFVGGGAFHRNTCTRSDSKGREERKSSHTQTLKSHDNIWCKVEGDTYFLLYFASTCHMLLFKREKIVFYG